MSLPTSLMYHLTIAAVTAHVAGCSGYLLTADDVVVVPNQQAAFVASVDTRFFYLGVEDVPVRFYVDGGLVAQGKTDSLGIVRVSALLTSRHSRYEVQADIPGAPARREGRIFHWRQDRTIVGVDLDDTISHTNYSDLFITDLDTRSPPLLYASRTLKKLQQAGFQILYVSARPRWLHTKTAEWLGDNDFPPGPALHADCFEACLKQAEYKEKMLIAFRKRFPNTLIGIGDKVEDDRAYGTNRMLALILGQPRSPYREHCISVKDWREIEAFFQRYNGRLCDPQRLAALIESTDMNLRPLFQSVPVAEAAAYTPHTDARRTAPSSVTELGPNPLEARMRKN